MTDAFVPLIAAPAGAAPARPVGPVRLKPISAVPETFERATPALLASQESAPASAASSAKANPLPAPTPVPAPGPACEPKITFERQGDTITHIRIQCGCGQVTELKCEY